MQTLLPGGRAPAVGDVFRNPDLAHSLRLIAEGGRDAYYKGRNCQAHCGGFAAATAALLREKDFADYSSEWVDPISTTYRGWTVYELPPNGQGLAALEMLNIMETFPLEKFGLNSTNALHTMIEAKKLAYADLVRYIGDPKFSKLPVAQLLSKDWAAERAKLIDPNKANCNVGPGTLPQGGDNTIYLSVVDRDGNMVSLIQSIYCKFRLGHGGRGHGIRAPKSRRALQPGPQFAERARAAQAPAAHHHSGVHGKGRRAHRVWHHGRMEPVAGARAVRLAHRRFPSEYSSGDGDGALHQAHLSRAATSISKIAFPGNVRAELEAKGHILKMHNGYSNTFGGGQAVMRDFAAGVNYGASDPRKDGAAVPELPPAAGKQ